MDALTLVRQDHRKLEALLERYEQLDGDDGEGFRRVGGAIVAESGDGA